MRSNHQLLEPEDLAIILKDFNKQQAPPESLEDIQKFQIDQDKLTTRLMMNAIGDKKFMQNLADGVKLVHQDISQASFDNLIIKENSLIKRLFNKK